MVIEKYFYNFVMGQIPEILLLGSISRDRIMKYNDSFLEHFKGDLETLSISLLVESMTETCGGIAANIAYSLALLNDSSTILTAVGSDADSYIESLREMGVDTSRILVSNELPTASFSNSTDSCNRAIGFFHIGAMEEAVNISLKPWKDESPLVVQSAHYPEAMAKHVTEAREFGLTLIYDVGQQIRKVSLKDLEKGLSYAQILMLNEDEMRILLNRTGRSMSSINSQVPIVLTTLGENGSVISGKSVKKSIKIPAVKVKQVVDPTGAGDAYRAGFLYGYRRDWDLEICGQMGSTAASFVVEKHGCQAHSFTKEEFAHRYSEFYKESINLS